MLRRQTEPTAGLRCFPMRAKRAIIIAHLALPAPNESREEGPMCMSTIDRTRSGRVGGSPACLIAFRREDGSRTIAVIFCVVGPARVPPPSVPSCVDSAPLVA